jgi:tyrosine-protein kinase Etk/Wzc
MTLTANSPSIPKAAPVPEPDGEAFRDVLAVLARRWRLVIGLPMLLATITGVVVLLLPRTWSSTVVFMPERSDLGRLGNLAGIASQFGMNLPFGESGLSPVFYEELVGSQQFLGNLATEPLSVSDSAAGRTLMDALEVDAKTPALRRDRAVRKLKKRIVVTSEDAVGLVRVRSTMPSPELAAATGRRIVELVNEFNGERRRTRAKAEREFAERRQREALSELRQAEGALLSFLMQNRSLGSPGLQSQRERLNREVQLRQQLYVSISQAYEQSRMEEVRDTPIISVVEEAELPARPDSRKVVQKVALSLAIGALLGAFLALLLERRERRRPGIA